MKFEPAALGLSLIALLALAYGACHTERTEAHRIERERRAKSAHTPGGQCDLLIERASMDWATCVCVAEDCQIITTSSWDGTLKRVDRVRCTSEGCGLLK